MITARREPIPAHVLRLLIMFKIETRSADVDWTDDPNRLGYGIHESDNIWRSEAEALAACDELAVIFACPRSDLRVVPADA